MFSVQNIPQLSIVANIILAILVIYLVYVLFNKQKWEQTPIDFGKYSNKILEGYSSREFQGFALISGLLIYTVIKNSPLFQSVLEIWVISFVAFSGFRTFQKYQDNKKIIEEIKTAGKND